MANQSRIHIPYITFAQVVAAISVLALHANGCFWSFSTKRYWITANIIECVFYFAVPVFFMITGVTLIDYPDRYSLSKYFMKRTIKVVIPFIIWSLLGLLYLLSIGTIKAESLTFLNIVNNILKGNGYVSYFWFFPSLFCVYLCIPLLAAVPKTKRRSIFSYLAASGLLLNILIPFVKSVFHLNIQTPLSVDIVRGYLFYVICGVLIHETTFSLKARVAIYVTGVIGLLLHILGTYFMSIEAGKIVETYKGYIQVPCVLYSLAVFVFLKDAGHMLMNTSCAKFISFLGKFSFATYLLQWFIFNIIDRIFTFNKLSIWYRLSMPAVVFAITIAVTLILRKIPLVRKIVP